MVYASEQKRKDIKARREEWQEQQKTMDQNHLIFLDESGVNLNMTRRYGRAIGKARVYDYVPLNTPRNTTLLSSIRIEDATMVHKEISGALNGVIFLEYIRNDLAPTLRQGDIVIMDNLRVHKVAGVRQAIEEKGASVLYLPPYSPDLNPIEMLWSKIKAFLREQKARDAVILLDKIQEAYSTISLRDILGWFSAAGYMQSFAELL
jgi:transposase